MTLGEYDLNHSGIGYFCHLMGLIFECIIFLNLLIAVMADTFNTVKSNYDIYEWQLLCALMLEIETLMFWKRDEGKELYIHLCRYVF